MNRLLITTLVGLSCVTLLGCGAQTKNAKTSMDELRRIGPGTSDPEVAESWLSAELLSRGGDGKRALEAREVLDKLTVESTRAHLLRGIQDMHRGQLSQVSEHFIKSLRSAREEDNEHSALYAWYAANEALSLRHLGKENLWAEHEAFIKEAIAKPGFIGWRARAELVDWLSEEAWGTAQVDIQALHVREFGCVTQVRLAGPFGRNAFSDTIKSFPAELPGPWPARWQPSSEGQRAGKQLSTETQGCNVSSSESSGDGVYYAETYLDLPKAKNLVLVMQGSLALWVNDQKVLDRDPRKWGEWPRFGVAVRLPAGRHRLLGRLTDSSTTLRVLELDGRPAEVQASTDASPGYSIEPPKLLPDPNPLMNFIEEKNSAVQGDDLLRVVAANLAQVEGQAAIASVLIQPLVKQPTQASGIALATAAHFAQSDPVYNKSQAEDLARSLQLAAVRRDPKLWLPRVMLTMHEARSKGLNEGIRPLQKLVDEFPEVPSILNSLATFYGELGWEPERIATIKLLGERFPRDPDTLSVVARVYEERGEFEKADALTKRILELTPDSHILLDLAIARQDYDEALKELQRLKARRPDRKDIASQIEDLLLRSGNTKNTWEKLEAAIENDPQAAWPRLELADAKYAGGQHQALRQALIGAIEAGADYSVFSETIDLMEGVTELEPYRLDGRKIIAEYEASGEQLAGTAARILDYSALTVRSDASSRLLNHSIVRILSSEAIGRFAEQSPPSGIVLNMRVIKQDGRILEPEFVSGKPTITMPHLELGDYIETETLVSLPGSPPFGHTYSGPRWFFQEENIAYWHSQFVVIAPANRSLMIEARGPVPEPTITQDTGRVIRSWLVTNNPAAKVEPMSAPLTEFLPSVHVGWGADINRRLSDLNDSAIDLTPIDPRVAAIATQIVSPAKKKSEQARKLYHWVLDNIEDGEETDGRRVVIGKQGNRWKAFITLCRARGIEARFAVAQSRIATPSIGPLSRVNDFNTTLMRVRTEAGFNFLTFSNKFNQFGYIPDDIRGMPAYVLGGPKAEPITLPDAGISDLIEHEAKIALAKNGSAEITLTQRFHGKYAASLRAGLVQIAEARLRDVIESRLLGAELQGARLIRHQINHLDDLDKPLELVMTAEMSVFAQLSAGALVIEPPFAPRVGQLATLHSRQTPLFLSDATHLKTKLIITLPEGTQIEGALPKFAEEFQKNYGKVKDRLEGNQLILERELYLASGRVQPADYAAFQQFARGLDNALNSAIRVR